MIEWEVGAGIPLPKAETGAGIPLPKVELGAESLHRLSAVPLPLAREAGEGRGRGVDKPPLGRRRGPCYKTGPRCAPAPLAKGGWRRTGLRAMNKGALAVPKGSGAGRRPAEGGFIPPPRFLCGIRSGAWAELGAESLHRLSAVPLPLAREAFDGRGCGLRQPPLPKGGGASGAGGGGILPPRPRRRAQRKKQPQN